MKQVQMNWQHLEDSLAISEDSTDLFNNIVNLPFEDNISAALMFLGIMVLLIVDKEAGVIKRIALSDTELAQNTTEVSFLPFEAIQIPLGFDGNIIAAAISSQMPKDTTDWKFLFDPALSADQARINQASAGIAYSAVYPLDYKDGAALIFSYYQYKHGIGDEQNDFMQKYADLVTKYLKNKQPTIQV